MVIKSSRSDALLEFSQLERDFVLVALSSRDHSAVRRVCVYTDREGIARLLRSAATDWRGWSGSKTWESIEGELRLSLECDNLGHVTLAVALSDDQGQPDPWRLHTELSLESGQLEHLAEQAERFFSSEPAA